MMSDDELMAVADRVAEKIADMVTERLSVRLAVTSGKEVLTVDEAVAFTGLRRSWLYRLTAERKIPHFKPHGKNIYFRRSELEEWMTRGDVLTTGEMYEDALRSHPSPAAKKFFTKITK